MLFQEYHLHVYFHDVRTQAIAFAFRAAVIDAVNCKDFIAIVDGITLPRLNKTPPSVNLKPVGPHPCGSFEVWVPQEHLSGLLSLAMALRNGLSMLLHPLSSNELQDHTKNAIWLGKPLSLGLDNLKDRPGNPVKSQYPTLYLGYASKTS
jgi:DOPA 4,5-dioxygenase